MKQAELDRKSDHVREARIREFHGEMCKAVCAGDITDVKANELVNDFADRLSHDGSWS